MQYRIRRQENWGNYKPPFIIQRKEKWFWRRIASAWSAEIAEQELTDIKRLEHHNG